MMRHLAFTIILSISGTVYAAQYTATWAPYTHSGSATVTGFNLWRGGDPYTLVAEFPSWARGGRWTQDEPIASGEVFTLTAVFADATESPRSAVYVYPMGDGMTGIRHARFKAVDGVTAAPLTKTTGARLR